MQSSSETDESESSEDGEDLTSSGVCLSKIKYYSNICNNEWNIGHENCHSDEVSFKMSELKCCGIIIVGAGGGRLSWVTLTYELKYVYNEVINRRTI